MLYKCTIQQHCSITILIHGNPGTSCICILRVYNCSSIMVILLRWHSLLTAILFIPVGGNNDCIFKRYKGYCAHALRYLIVEEATPYPEGSSTAETSLMPTRISAM